MAEFLSLAEIYFISQFIQRQKLWKLVQGELQAALFIYPQGISDLWQMDLSVTMHSNDSGTGNASGHLHFVITVTLDHNVY